MMTTKKKSFNTELDDLLEGLELPTDKDIRQDTHNAKVSHAKKLFYQTVAGQKHKELVKTKSNSPENLAKRAEQMREERGVPCKFISPNGQEFSFRSAGEAGEHFGQGVSKHVPLSGAKRITRRELKNWIVVRDDGSATKTEINKLKNEVKLNLNPPKKIKKERDMAAWAEKMEAWKNSKEGKAEKKKSKDRAKIMGKKNSQKVMTPDGEFDSLTLAAEFYGIGKASMSQRLRDHPSKYWKVL
jgi:hypothetical protein